MPLKQYQPADLLELARIYGQLGELSRAASTLRVYNLLKPVDADGQRELAQVALKLNEKKKALALRPGWRTPRMPKADHN